MKFKPSDIEELWSQLNREDLRGIIAVTNGPTERDVDITGCVENLLNSIKNPMNDKLISLLNAAQHWAIQYRSSLRHQSSISAATEHIEDLKAAIKKLKETETNLASGWGGGHYIGVREDHERENNQLIHAMHGLEKELIRATGELRSALLVSSKSDLRLTGVEMKVSELTGGLNEVKANALKALAEIRARIDAADTRIATLETQLADADVPAAAETALTELKAIHKQLDDIVPDPTDLPTVPPVVIPPEPPTTP